MVTCPSFLEERHQISPCLLCWGYYIDPNLSFELASPSSGRKNGWLLFASTVNGRARNPLTPVELFRMIDPPSFMSGIAFLYCKEGPTNINVKCIIRTFLGNGAERLVKLANASTRKEDIDMTFSFLPVGCMPTCRFVRIMVILVKSPLICYLSAIINRSLYIHRPTI